MFLNQMWLLRQTKDLSMFKTEEALAIIGGHVDEELLLRNEYLAIENEILRKKISGRIKLSQHERMRLATIGKKIGIKALREVAMIGVGA